MMMAGVGGKKAVRGSRIAIPDVGPMPGSTPTSVPRTEPKKANRRFWGESAAAKPLASREKVSTESDLA
jgi:hypothetical protein